MIKAENIIEQLGLVANQTSKEQVRKLMEICKMLKGLKGIESVERALCSSYFGRKTEIKYNSWRGTRETNVIYSGEMVPSEVFIVKTKTGTYQQIVPTNNDLHREFCTVLGQSVIDTDVPRMAVEFDKAQTKFISKATVFTQVDMLRPAFECIRFGFSAGNCEVVATDGNRLIKKDLTVNTDSVEVVLIPAKNLRGFKGRVELFESYYKIDGQRFKYVSDEVVKQYPNYNSVWPTYEGSVEVFKNDLVEALKPMQKIVNQYTKQTQFHFNGKLKIVSENLDYGFNTSADVNYLSKSESDYRVDLNLSFVLEALNVITTDKIKIGHKGNAVILNDEILIMRLRPTNKVEEDGETVETVSVIKEAEEIKPIRATYIDNCSHGYLAVSMTDFVRVMTVDTAKKITGYSGINSTTVHLEEDCDAGTFMNEAKAKGIELDITNSYNERFTCSKNYSVGKVRFNQAA